MIRLAAPLIDEDDIAAVSAVLRSGNLVQGEQVISFETAVADLVGSAHAVAVTNCTAALELALRAAGVGPGDEVAVAAYSWISTANVVELVGATPVFVDIDVTTHNMASEALDRTLNDRPDIRAILPVHTFGNMRGIAELVDVARNHGTIVIEDAACALGAMTDAGRAGSIGEFGCFSFHPRKAITTGEGGMIVTDDEDAAVLLRSLRNHGLDPMAPSPDFVRAAPNMRMTEFQAALGRSQLTKLNKILDIRRQVATGYAAALGSSGVVLPDVDQEHVLQSLVVLLPRDLPPATDIIPQIRARGVEVTVGTWHLPLTTHFRARLGHEPGDFPGTDEVFHRAVSLPLHHDLSSDDIGLVVDVLLDVVKSS